TCAGRAVPRGTLPRTHRTPATPPLPAPVTPLLTRQQRHFHRADPDVAVGSAPALFALITAFSPSCDAISAPCDAFSSKCDAFSSPCDASRDGSRDAACVVSTHAHHTAAMDPAPERALAPPGRQRPGGHGSRRVVRRGRRGGGRGRGGLAAGGGAT